MMLLDGLDKLKHLITPLGLEHVTLRLMALLSRAPYLREAKYKKKSLNFTR
jgi:hypothetical protein